MATARSSLSPPSKGGISSPGKVPTWQQRGGPQRNKKVSKAKNGKPRRHQRHYHNDRPNDVHPIPEHNVLLHRLSPPSPSSLLERIGGSAEDDDEVASSSLTDWHPTDEERMLELTDNFTAPHRYTPDPGEVERFLESVIGSPPSPPVHACLGEKSTLALETHDHPVDHHQQESSSFVLYSPTQTSVNNLPSASLTPDRQHSPLLDDTMPPPSPATIEECRKLLVPVLLASAHARDPAKRLDTEQCQQLLSNDHCKDFIRRAKEMRRQLSSLVSQKTLMHQGWSGSPKRDRADDVDTWARNTRLKFNSIHTDVSRKDSDITLVDFPSGRLPPKAPRAMLHASQAKFLKDAQDRAPYNALVTSPTTEDCPPSATSLIDLVHQAIRMFPTLVSEIDTTNVAVGTSMEDPSGLLGQVVSPAHASASNFVSHLPTQPGVWFRQQGREHAEIVDVDIDVSDDMFYMSRERLRMYLRLSSVFINAVTETNTATSPHERHALHWPKKGKLVVQVNPASERSKTWLPYTLESDPLDVTSCMRPGKNTFRFIQLSDLSKFTFVLTASPPPPEEEEWRSWDWASFVESRSSSIDDATNGLSEFAHIPVTVRS